MARVHAADDGVSTYGIVTSETNGHLTAAYAVTLVAMLFTARSYGHMARLMPSAGSAYTFASRNFGTSAGFMVGWALLMDYLFIPMISYLAIGIYMKQIFPVCRRAYGSSAASC